MIIGIPKEIKASEYRVASTPEAVKELVQHGHKVLVETRAGVGSGFMDRDYEAAGAEMVDKHQLYTKSEMIYKVKEFFPEEFKYFREGQILFTYIHSNAHIEQTDAMLDAKVIGIAYEDINVNGTFPLLAPMSELAGKGAFLAACHFLQSIYGGPGLMLNDVAGQKKPVVAIIGAGISGLSAAQMATSFGNRVIILDISSKALEKAKELYPHNLETLVSNEASLHYAVKECDVLMNCINWPKWRTDHLVDRDMLKTMKPGAMIVDVACDEHGAIETTVSTSHDDPIYIEEGVVHYCVDNIPSAYSRTATYSLSNATLPYALEIANKGARSALEENSYLRSGLSFYYGDLTLKETGLKQNRPFITPEEALEKHLK